MGLTPEQQLVRRTGITASEIAALAGASRFATPMDIYGAKKLGLDVDDSIPLDLGNALEEPIAKLWRKREGMYTAPCATVRHPKFAFAVCTPDRAGFYDTPPSGLVVDQGGTPLLSLEQIRDAPKLVQCKSTSWRMRAEWGEPGSDVVPDEYFIQEIWEMGITRHKQADIAVLFDKDRFEIYRVTFREDVFLGLYQLAEQFMVDHVLPGHPPPPDASERYAEVLAKLVPRPLHEQLPVLPEELSGDVMRLAMMKHVRKLADAGARLYGNRLRLAIGDGTGFKGDFGRVTWKKNRDSVGVDFEAAMRTARKIGMSLLDQFDVDDPEKASAVAAYRQRLMNLEADHPKTRVGPRVLRTWWAPEFKEAVGAEKTVDLSQVLADVETAKLSSGEEDSRDEEGEE
jgi:predicted phage-related endonuclease